MWHEAFVKGWLMRELEDMRLFRALGVSQSLAAAGRLRNRTPSAVTVRLQRIEARMGLRLVTRAAGGICAVGGISLTNEGQHLIQEAIENPRTNRVYFLTRVGRVERCKRSFAGRGAIDAAFKAV